MNFPRVQKTKNQDFWRQAPTKVIALGLSEGHISLIDQARITSSNDKVFKIRLPQRQRVCDIYSFHGKDLSTYPDLPEEAEPTFALKIKERPILYCFSSLGPFWLPYSMANKLEWFHTEVERIGVNAREKQAENEFYCLSRRIGSYWRLSDFQHLKYFRVLSCGSE